MMVVKSLKYFFILFSSTWLYDLFRHDIIILYLLILLYCCTLSSVTTLTYYLYHIT